MLLAIIHTLFALMISQASSNLYISNWTRDIACQFKFEDSEGLAVHRSIRRNPIKSQLHSADSCSRWGNNSLVKDTPATPIYVPLRNCLSSRKTSPLISTLPPTPMDSSPLNRSRKTNKMSRLPSISPAN